MRSSVYTPAMSAMRVDQKKKYNSPTDFTRLLGLPYTTMLTLYHLVHMFNNFAHKSHQTCLILKDHHSRLVSINNIYLLPIHYTDILRAPMFRKVDSSSKGSTKQNQSSMKLVPELITPNCLILSGVQKIKQIK